MNFTCEIKNILKNQGIKGIFVPLAKKVGKKQALMMIARLGLGGGFAVTGAGTIPGMVMAGLTAYQIYDIIGDWNENQDNNLPSGTTF